MVELFQRLWANAAILRSVLKLRNREVIVKVDQQSESSAYLENPCPPPLAQENEIASLIR